MKCKYCGEEILVWSFIGKDFKQVPYKPGPKVKSVLCGRCVAHGALRKDTLEERRKKLVDLLKEPIQNLKSFRQKMGITQEELSKILDVDRSMISKVEKGVKPIPESWKERIRGHITLSTIA